MRLVAVKIVNDLIVKDTYLYYSDSRSSRSEPSCHVTQPEEASGKSLRAKLDLRYQSALTSGLNSATCLYRTSENH